MKPIISRITVEVLGIPKEHVENTLQRILSKLKEEEDIQVLNTKVFETKEMDNKLFNTFADIEFKTMHLKRVLEICYDYTPSTIEILDPAGLMMDCDEIAEFLNDFLAKTHKHAMVSKKLQAENVYLKKELKK